MARRLLATRKAERIVESVPCDHKRQLNTTATVAMHGHSIWSALPVPRRIADPGDEKGAVNKERDGVADLVYTIIFTYRAV